MCCSYLGSQSRFKYLSLFSFSLLFTLWPAATLKSFIRQVLFILLTITRFGFWLGLCNLLVFQNPGQFYVPFSLGRSLYIYHFAVWSNKNSSTISNGLPSPCSNIKSCTLFALVCIIIIIIYSFTVFHIKVSWWFFTGVWATASLLNSFGLFSLFWASSIILSYGWSPLVRQLPSTPGLLIIL